MRSTIVQNSSDPFWAQLGGIMAQYDGLAAGYNAYSGADKLDSFAFFMLNGCGDLFDLLPATCPAFRRDPAAMTPEEFMEFFSRNGHCSALVKLTGDFSQLFMAHSSWFRYQAMLRIMKHCMLKTTLSTLLSPSTGCMSTGVHVS